MNPAEPLEPIDFALPLDGLLLPSSDARVRLRKSSGGRIDRAEVRKRAAAAMQRNLRPYKACENLAREWVIVGGGPSAKREISTIRRLKARGANVVSVNKSHDWLLENGIVPWAHVLLDPKEWVADYVKRPRRDVRYFVASQCHDSVFENLKDYPVFLWHAGQDFPEGPEPSCVLREKWPTTTWFVTPGKTTVSLRVPFLASGMGPIRPEHFHLIGLDSSRADGHMHAYEKPEAPDAQSGNVAARYRGRRYIFDTNTHMAKQWVDFDEIIKDRAQHIALGHLSPNFAVTVYGSGLLPFYAATIGLHADAECNAAPEAVGGFIDVVSEPDPSILYGLTLPPINLGAA